MSSWKFYNRKDVITERPEEENETDRDNEVAPKIELRPKTKIDKIFDFHNENKNSYDFLTKNNKWENTKSLAKQKSNNSSEKHFEKVNKKDNYDITHDDLEFEIVEENNNSLEVKVF